MKLSIYVGSVSEILTSTQSVTSTSEVNSMRSEIYKLVESNILVKLTGCVQGTSDFHLRFKIYSGHVRTLKRPQVEVVRIAFYDL